MTAHPSAPALPDPELGTVQSLQRGLHILELIITASAPVRLADVTRLLEMDKASAFRFLRTLEHNGLVTKDPQRKTYAVGGKLLYWMAALGNDVGIVALARPYLKRLVEDTNESGHVGILSSDQALLLDYLASESMVVIKNRIGVYEPLHCTALGKALLAFQPRERQCQLLDRRRLQRFTRNTITDRRTLERTLAQVRREAVALDDAEYDEILYCVASPIIGQDGLAVGAIGVSIVHPLAIQQPDRITGARRHVRRHARDLTAALAGEMVAARVFDVAEAPSARPDFE